MELSFINCIGVGVRNCFCCDVSYFVGIVIVVGIEGIIFICGSIL